MKTTLVTFLVISLITLFGFKSAMASDTRKSDLASIYAAGIDSHISRCETKAARINSTSENIRKEAAMRSAMGTFFKNNKEELINEMISEGIGTKKYKIDYFLSSRFFQSLKKQAKI